MLLLTIFNPFLTREPRTTGFEGVATEICLKQRANKTDRQHACKTEYLVMFHGREDSVKRHECRSQKANVHGFELQLECAAWRNGARPPFAPFACTRSPRALTSRRVDDGPQLISLMVQHTNSGLACSPDKAQVEGPSSASGTNFVVIYFINQ